MNGTTKENQRITLTKRLLKESLLKLLHEKDIRKITVKELCEDSGINRTTFYNHYGRPQDVLSEMEDDLIAKIPVIPLDDREYSRQAFLEQTTSVLQYVQDNKEFAKLLFMNDSASWEFARKAFHFPAIRQAMEDAVPETYDETDRSLLITFIQSGLYSMLRQWVITDTHKSVAEMAELLTRMASVKFWKD